MIGSQLRILIAANDFFDVFALDFIFSKTSRRQTGMLREIFILLFITLVAMVDRAGTTQKTDERSIDRCSSRIFIRANNLHIIFKPIQIIFGIFCARMSNPDN